MRYWGVRVGPGGQYAEVARKGGFVAIEWHKLGDLSWLASAKDGAEAGAKLLKEHEAVYAMSGMKAAISAGQVRRFVREIAAGDLVLLPHAAKGLVYVGRVEGGFQYVADPDDGCPYRQRRRVEWLRDLPRKELPPALLNSLGSLVTVFNLDNRAVEVEAALGMEPTTKAGTKVKPLDVVAHVLGRLHAMHPKDFESFVAAYFVAIGYTAEPTPYTGDGGIDVTGTLDAEGLAQVLLRVQVKRTRDNVGIETVLKTRGALEVDAQGAIISLGGFTEKAKQEAEATNKKTIVLVDGESFVEMLLDHWDDLDEAAKSLLAIRPKERLPVRERFAVVSDAGADA